MRVLIVEDEDLAARQLKQFVEAYDSGIVIDGIIQSGRELLERLHQHSAIDLIFCDIELRDGNVLPWLEKARPGAAIIFTTAYDQYWSTALKNNGIEYILKPITREKVFGALDKVAALKKLFGARQEDILVNLSKLIDAKNTSYKKRFPARLNHEVFIIEAEDVLFFRIIEGVVFAYVRNQKKYPLTIERLTDLETKLDPDQFFRINRSEIINAQFIDSIQILPNNEYVIKLHNTGEKLSISQSRVSSLKNWL